MHNQKHKRRRRKKIRTTDEVFEADLQANKSLIEKAERWSSFDLVIRRVRHRHWEVGTLEDGLRFAFAPTLKEALFSYIEGKRLLKLTQEFTD